MMKMTREYLVMNMHPLQLSSYFKVALFVFIMAFFSSTKAQTYASFRLLNEANLSVPWMKETLHVNAAQVHALNRLNMRYDAAFDSIRRSSDVRHVKYQKTHRKIEQRDRELKYILSEKQFTLYEKRRKSMYSVSATHRSDTIMAKHVD